MRKWLFCILGVLISSNSDKKYEADEWRDSNVVIIDGDDKQSILKERCITPLVHGDIKWENLIYLENSP